MRTVRSRCARIRAVGVACLFLLAASALCRGQEQAAADRNLKILYAGRPGSDREKDFVDFLKKYFNVVQTGNLETFQEADTQGFDVTLLDWDRIDFEGPRPKVSEGFSRPIMTLGVPGGVLCQAWRLKTGYLWNCLSNAAHAESLDHEVYHTPLAVQPEFEFQPTPDNYRETYEGPGRLPDRIKVWRVQNSPKGSALASALGFLDSPDAEILAVGFNLLKHYGDIGIGRQGNFLQWGYGDPPSQMTEAGRRLFINCIHYIHRFDGVTPLVRERSNHRRNALSWAAYLAVAPADQRDRVRRAFPKEVWDKYQADAEGLLAYYKANLELVYWDGVYYVDEELKSLGIDSNRKIETLERLFELRKDPAHQEIAQRLLDRYTDGHMTFDFQNGRDRIYFTDLGGHRFLVVPEGYPIRPKSKDVEARAVSP